MGLITAATTPILFSSLSRLQDDNEGFKDLFLKFQKLVGILVIPIGVGIFCYSDLITKILLGNQWLQASSFIGLWGLTSAITIVLSHFSSEVYRAKGRPKLSVLAQFLHLIVLWPTVFISVKYGFETLYTARSLVRFELIAVNLFIMSLILKMPVKKMFINIIPSCVAALSMLLVLYLPPASNILTNIAYIFISAIIYICVLVIFPEERKLLFNLPILIRK